MAGVGLFSIAFAAIYGWIMNILILISLTGDITGEWFVRLVGIFIAPVGVVMGYV